MRKKQNPGQRGLDGVNENQQRRGNLVRKNTHEQRRRQQAKRIIIFAANWGLLPMTLADWLIARLGVRHA